MDLPETPRGFPGTPPTSQEPPEGTPESQRTLPETDREAQGCPRPRSSWSWFADGPISERKVHFTEPPQFGQSECTERLKQEHETYNSFIVFHMMHQEEGECGRYKRKQSFEV